MRREHWALAALLVGCTYRTPLGDLSVDASRADAHVGAFPDGHVGAFSDAHVGAVPDARRSPSDGPATFADAQPPLGELDFVAVPDPVDMVHDGRRGRLYITTSAGAVVEYDLERRVIAGKLELATKPLRGIDLSPDGDRLLVADSTVGTNQNHVHLIHLVARSHRHIFFPLDFSEAGTFMPVFIDDEVALVSSSFSGSGSVPLRQIHLAGGTTQEIRSVRQNTMLAASADRSVIAYAEANVSPGSFGAYRPSTGAFLTAGTFGALYEIAPSRTGTQFALPTADGVLICDARLAKVTTVGDRAVKEPLGVVYSPTSERFYVTWRYRSSSPRGATIEGYDGASFQVVEPIQTSRWYDEPGVAFYPGRLRISRDGTLLFATFRNGVGIHAVRP